MGRARRAHARRLPLALTALLVLAVTPPAAPASTLAASASQPLSAPTSQPGCTTSGVQPASEGTPVLGVHPRDSARVAVAWEQDLRGDAGGVGLAVVAAISSDGGRTFERRVIPGLSVCREADVTYVTAPTLAFGPDGVLYVAARATVGEPRTIRVVRSADGGTTWDPPVAIGASVGDSVLAADPELPGRAYLALTVRSTYGAVIQLATTSDGGRSWSEPRPVHEPPADNALLDDLVVLPGGRLLVLFKQPSPGGLQVPGVSRTPILAIGSPDRGASWSAPVEVGRVPANGLPHDPERGRPGETDGSLYAPGYATGVPIDDGAAVAWQSNLAFDDGRILLSRSSDGGASWSEPAPVARPGAQAFVPELTAAPGGTLGLSWYDMRSDRRGDDELTTTARFAHSHDGGASWTETALGSPFDMRRAPGRPTRTLGGRQGLAPLGGGFAAAFVQAPPVAVSGPSDVFLSRLTAAVPRLRLGVAPRTARAGQRTRFRFRVTTGTGSASRPVSGARVAFAGRRVRTDRRGRASLAARLSRVGRYRARAAKAGLVSATATVSVARPRARP